MAISFKSVGHFFATFYKKAVAEIPAIEATKTTVEAVTAAIPGAGPVAATIEDAGYAVLGELSSVLNAGGDAAKAKLLDAGLDENVITTVQNLVKGFSQISTLAKSL